MLIRNQARYLLLAAAVIGCKAQPPASAGLKDAAADLPGSQENTAFTGKCPVQESIGREMVAMNDDIDPGTLQGAPGFGGAAGPTAMALAGDGKDDGKKSSYGDGTPQAGRQQAVAVQGPPPGLQPRFDAARYQIGFVGEKDMRECIMHDLESIARTKPSALRFTRYFTLTHLYNAALFAKAKVDRYPNAAEPKQLMATLEWQQEGYRQALFKLVNSLSWGPSIETPIAIDPLQTIFRVDLRAYGWSPQTWNEMIARNPYNLGFGQYEGWKAREDLLVDGEKKKFDPYVLTDVQREYQYYVRGDWFVFAASWPPLYYKMLGMTDNEYDFENPQPMKDETDQSLIARRARSPQVDSIKNMVTDNLMRIATLNESFTAISGRRVLERHEARFAKRPRNSLTLGVTMPRGRQPYYWKSYMFDDQKSALDGRTVTTAPLGPCIPGNRVTGEGIPRSCLDNGQRVTDRKLAEQHVFVHDAGENIFSLPNGLQGYMIVDREGMIIPFVDPNVSRDRKRKYDTDGKGAGMQGEQLFRDESILAGVSCMSCHTEGLNTPFSSDAVNTELHQRYGNGSVGDMEPWVQKALKWYPVEGQLGASQEPCKNYEPKNLREYFESDRCRYQESLKLLGLEPSNPDPVAVMFKHFFLDLMPRELVAAEFGISIEVFSKKLDELIESGNKEAAALLPLVEQNAPLDRGQFEKTFAALSASFFEGTKFLPPRVPLPNPSDKETFSPRAMSTVTTPAVGGGQAGGQAPAK
jgi:hypothetical protein